jgi:hypothetical protein
MTFDEWFIQLKIGDKIAVRYEVHAGVVMLQEVQAIVEPGQPFGEGVAEGRYVLGTIDYFDGRGLGWRVDYTDSMCIDLEVKRTFTRLEQPTPAARFRSYALDVLECSGVAWGNLSDEQLRTFLDCLRDADAIPIDFVPL